LITYFAETGFFSDSLVPETEVSALLIPVLAILKQLYKYSVVKTCYICWILHTN